MASIAYITDRNMIEYHRLNGNQNINFWKPSSQKKINDFRKGDYLFFLAKGSEQGRNREKGIIGYGKLDRIKTMSFEKMWYEYKTMNGYETKQQLREAVEKVAKDHTVPKSMQCILLNNVTFFQVPIYLSEFGVTISKQIESYFYVDREGENITSQILKKADEFGIDIWSMLVNDSAADLTADSLLYELRQMIEKYQSDFFTVREERARRQYAMKLMSKIEGTTLLSADDAVLVKTEPEIKLYIPMMINKTNLTKRMHYILSLMMMYAYELHKKTATVKIAVIFNQDPGELYCDILSHHQIDYQILSETELIDQECMED